MGFSRQEYWSGLPFPSSGDLPNPGIECRSSALKADSSLFELIGKLYPKVTKHKFELVGGSSPMGKKESSELLPTLYFWVISFSPPEPRILGLNLHDCREKM